MECKACGHSDDSFISIELVKEVCRDSRDFVTEINYTYLYACPCCGTLKIDIEE